MKTVVALLVASGIGCAPAAPAPQPPPSAESIPGRKDWTALEREVLSELNRARTSPRVFAQSLELLVPRFDGKLLRREGHAVPTLTAEGVAAVNEAVADLRHRSPIAALAHHESLARAARDHVADQGRTGKTGHTGSDGSTVTSRVDRHGRWLIGLAENIDYSRTVRGRDVVERLIIDDGVRDRGHRKNVFDPNARLVGVACGPHPRYETMCVVVQAGGMR